MVSVLVILEWHPQWPEDLHRQLWQRLRDLHQWILRYPSLHSSGNNHRVAEVTACFIIECLVPQWRPITLAARSAQLIRRLEQQFHSDGVGTEQAPYYQALVTEWMVLADCVAQKHTAPLPIGALLERSLSFLSELLDSHGNWPNIGDADDSVVIRTQLTPEPYVASIVSLAAAHLGQPAPWVQRNLRHSILGLDEAQLCKISTSRCFNDGGFSVLRSGPVQLFFDHGPLGFGTLPGHGHADALSVWMQVNGRPIWIDTGTGFYNRDPQWRSWIRSTAAHNTVTIDGDDQSTQTGPFNWANHAKTQLLSFSGHQGTVSAEHDGYGRIGVIHRREIELSSETVRICDQLTGSGSHSIVSRISLEASLSVEPIECGWKVLDGARVVATVTVNTDSLRPVCARQSGEAGPGCYSLNYNHLEPTTTLQWEGCLQLPARWQLEWRWTIPTEEL